MSRILPLFWFSSRLYLQWNLLASGRIGAMSFGDQKEYEAQLYGRFSTEQRLVDAVLHTYATKASSRWRWLPEVASPNGIPDLLVFKLGCTAEAAKQLSKVPPRWAYALSRLEIEGGFSASEFATRGAVSLQTATAAIRAFETAGFVTRCAESWVKIAHPSLVAEKIVAIEAKLRNWRRALFQATRYQDFANESWVILDSEHVAPAERNISLFRARGIGLAGVATDGFVRVLAEPVSREPRSVMRVWEIGALIAQRVYGEGLSDSE